jgi:hypothetical protein
MASEGFLLGDCSSNQYLKNYIQIKMDITTQDNHCKSKGEKKAYVNTVKLLLFRNSPIMVPMNTCVIHPNFSLHEVKLGKMASCYQYIEFTYKKEAFTEKARSPPPKKNVPLTEPSLYTKC